MTTEVNIKCSDIIKQFDGSTDFAEWIQKLELVAKLQKVKELENFLPLFLTGGAFAVYQGLKDGDKADYELVKKALTLAFSVDQFSAYEELVSRKLSAGESADVYLSDLNRLSGLISKSKKDDWTRCAFVAGLPEDIKRQLRASCSVGTMDIQELVEKTRNLLKSNEACLVGAIGKAKPDSHTSVNMGELTCFSCGKRGHFRRQCPDRQPREKGRLCFICGEAGHLAAACPAKKTAISKNE